MKHYIKITLIVFAFTLTFKVQAQNSDSLQKNEQSINKRGDYAMMVMKVQHLKAAIQTAKELKEKIPNIDFQIVTCGELVKDIAKDKILQNFIIQTQSDMGLKIIICRLSIKQLNINKSQISPEIPQVENGLTYMFGLQEQGYNTIIL
ncbi:hypothetical protein MM236_18745 [Belliella sp. DSM 107340]|uniref:DsrE/DsrF-like family protein n=1 Tax=Belliella calami TaxID=2923436 RepID=A0ABS9UTU0_9BACT|nr:hypothetical protein [Belliella calami]MCH7400040.1 hypothetical protein [Belliella calami]